LLFFWPQLTFYWEVFLGVTLLTDSSKMDDDPIFSEDGSFHPVVLCLWQMCYHGCSNPMHKVCCVLLQWDCAFCQLCSEVPLCGFYQCFLLLLLAPKLLAEALCLLTNRCQDAFHPLTDSFLESAWEDVMLIATNISWLVLMAVHISIKPVFTVASTLS
jgi:hypothetical protein